MIKLSISINDLPDKWRLFSKRLESWQIPDDVNINEDGIFDIECHKEPTLLIVQNKNVYILSESDLERAKHPLFLSSGRIFLLLEERILSSNNPC